MKIRDLREFTSARVNLGCSGCALPIAEVLKLQLAQVSARQAVHAKLDASRLALDVNSVCQDLIFVCSRAPDRVTYLRRPDLGRELNPDSRSLLLQKRGRFDAVFVLADGLSASALQAHAPGVIKASLRLLNPDDWRLAPFVVVEQARVAIGDEIGHCLGAALSIVLIGERPGLSCSDSLAIYLTWNPRPGLTDAARNCISNIHDDGLSYPVAAHKLAFLMHESRRRKLSGVELKEDAKALT
ncbi:MAG: ethanolamine ammonia-lyase subunit EutC [Acidobacteriaceae bacterium]|nr:ethanolamine ammonia-lyase subunit EutC [Acidobacteriaceae bacterium]